MESSRRVQAAGWRWIPAMLLLIATSACDRVPTFQELSGQEEQVDGVAPDQVAQGQDIADPPDPPAGATPPPPKSPQEIVAAFLATESRQRNTSMLKELAALDPEILEEITELDLRESQINDAAAPLLAKFPALEAVDVSGTAITNAGMVELAKAKGLRKVILDLMIIDGDGLAPLAGHQQMRELSLVNTPISDAAFEHLKKMDGLEVLRFPGTSTIQGYGFDELVKNGVMANLRKLEAGSTGIGYYGLRNLGKLSSLELLVIPDAQVSDEQLVSIAGCKNLRTLNIQQNPVGDATLKRLAKLKLLEWLSVAGCIGVTDAGLKHLRGLKNLRFLNLGGCPCSEEAVRELKEKYLPNTEIHFQQLVL